jgi:hypothetical protein
MASITISGQSRQRQIVILAVGGVILAGLLVFQLPRTLEALRGAESSPPATTEQTTPAPVSPVAPATPVTPVAPASTTPPTLGQSALRRFKSKDPFVQQINANSSGGTGSSSSSSSSGESSAPASSESASQPGTFRAVETSNGSSAAAGSATIAVNGAEETVGVSKAFPKGNPVFRLVSIGDGTARVGIASGTLKGGSKAVTLTKGEPLTLLNTVDGKRYKLELISVSS